MTSSSSSAAAPNIGSQRRPVSMAVLQANMGNQAAMSTVPSISSHSARNFAMEGVARRNHRDKSSLLSRSSSVFELQSQVAALVDPAPLQSQPEDRSSRQPSQSNNSVPEPLPPGWEERRTREGRVFFIDHNTRKTQWEDPRTGQRPTGASPAISSRTSSNDQLGDLPRGWEMRFNPEGRPYYIDHLNKKTQWEDPRTNSQEKQKQKSQDAPKYIRDYQVKLESFRAKLRQPDPRSKLEIKVRRAHIFEDSFRKIEACSAEELKKKLWITFDGEEGLDYGGLQREWFYMLSKEMFNPYYCLFEYSAADNYTLQISSNSDVNPDHLQYFHFIGRVIGMAIYHGKFLDAYFVSSFYKRLLKLPMDLQDLASIDPDRYNSFEWMLNNNIEGVLFETFSVEIEKFGEKVIYELKPGGSKIEVTEKNKKEYVELYVQWRGTRGTEDQTKNLLKGINEIIPIESFAMFDPKELEYLVSGIADIDLDDWQRNTVYKGYDPNDKVIRWFWVCVRGFNREQRARLLQFVTGTSRVPATGFKDLWGSDGPRRFCIEKWGTPPSLPRSHTCFNRVDLPPYESYEKLEQKLLFATEQTSGFGVE